MKFRPAHLVCLIALLAAGASEMPSNASNIASDGSDAVPAGFYVLPPELAAWLRQPDDTLVNISDLVRVATASRDFYDKVLNTQGGAGTEIGDLVRGNYALPLSGDGPLDPSIVLEGSSFVAQAMANKGASFAENNNAISDSTDDVVITSTANDSVADFWLLQQVAKPFYDRLIDIGKTIPAGLIVKGVSNGNESATVYNWPQRPPGPGDAAFDEAAYSAWLLQSAAPVTIAQVRQVFSFDNGQFTSQIVYSGSGMGSAKTSKAGSASDLLPDGKNLAKAEGAPVAGNRRGSGEGDDDGIARAVIALVVLTPME